MSVLPSENALVTLCSATDKTVYKNFLQQKISGKKFTIKKKIHKYMFNVNNMWLMIAILFEKHSQYLPAQRVSCC